MRRAAGDGRTLTAAASRWRGVKRHVRSPVTGSLIGKAAEFLSLAVLVTFVPRLLGPADYGSFALAFSVVVIASSALGLGGPSLMARFVPTASFDQRPALARALVVRLAGWRLLATTVLAVMGLVLTLVAPSRFPPLTTALVAAAIALDVAATLLLQVALGLGLTWAWNLRWALQNTVLVVATVVMVELAGARAAVAGVTIASGSALVLAAIAVARPLMGAKSGAAIPQGAMRFGLLQGISGVLILVMHRGGVVAVAILGGADGETGFAALAIGLGLAATYTVSQAFISQLPGLALQVGSDPESAERRAQRLAWAALLALLPLAIVAALLVETLVPRVFGEEFEPAGVAVGVALAVIPLAPLSALGSQICSLRLLPRLRLWSSATGAALFSLTAVLAVPPWGAVGGALAFLVGTLAGVLVIAVALPDATGRRLVAVGVGGAALVLAIGLLF